MLKRKKEIILHIGAHKTATTSIQSTLYKEENKLLLKENNIYYIEDWDRNNGRLIRSAFCDEPEKFHVNVLREYSSEEIIKINEKTKKDLINSLKDDGKLLITGEGISLLKIQNIEKLKELFVNNYSDEISFKIIYFIRNPIDLASSMFQQYMFGGSNRNDDDLKTEMKEFYKNRIQKFIKVFGRENVYVYSFEEACKSKFGPIGYFFNVIGIPNDKLKELAYDNKNEGLCHEAVEIARTINEEEPIIVNGKLNEKRKNLDLSTLKNIKGSKFVLERNNLYIIFEDIKNDLEWLKQEYGLDYLNEKEKIEFKQNKSFYDEISVIDTFVESSKFIRTNMIKYFSNKDKGVADSLKLLERKLFMYDFIFDVEKEYEIVEIKGFKESMLRKGFFEINKIKDDIYEINFKKDKEFADIYRELAYIFEKTNNFEQAYKYMCFAKEYRPNGETISRKKDEYFDILNS